MPPASTSCSTPRSTTPPTTANWTPAGSITSPAARAPTDEIRNWEARFYSRTDEYDLRASSAANIALAPDRYDFGKWPDVP